MNQNLVHTFPKTIGGYAVKSYTSPTKHRGSYEYLTHYVAELLGHVNGIEVTLVHECMTYSWWITPNMQSDEAHMDDIGPYETLEEAMIHFKLITEPV
jgi:hypothetical protein